LTKKDKAAPFARPVRPLVFMEALWPTTGPARNLIEFACRAINRSDSLLSAKVIVATFHRGTRPTRNEFVHGCREAGLEVHVIRERFLFDPAVVPQIRKLIALCKPDIIQSHAVKSHFLIRLSGLNRRYPWIAFQHGYTWTDSKTKIYNCLDRWSLPAASRVVTVCRPFAAALEKIGVDPKRIVIQHNSVKPFSPSGEREISDLRRRLGISMDCQVALCVGRFSREKAQRDLVEAVAILRKSNEHRKLKVILAGDGPDEGMLKKAAHSADVGEWLVFVGRVSNPTPYYTMADLFVLPSHTEGSPNALLEALAAGLPIVATSVGGVPEIVRNESEALLVEKQNPMALAQAMARVLDDSDLRHRLAETAQRRIHVFSPEAYCESILSLYQSCLAEMPKNVCS